MIIAALVEKNDTLGYIFAFLIPARMEAQAGIYGKIEQQCEAPIMSAWVFNMEAFCVITYKCKHSHQSSNVFTSVCSVFKRKAMLCCCKHVSTLGI